MCQNHPKNAKFLADAIGTEKRKTSVMATDYVGRFKSLNTKDEDRFRVEPDDIKNGLKTGEAVVFVKSPKNRLEKKVKIIETKISKKAEEYEKETESKKKIKEESLCATGIIESTGETIENSLQTKQKLTAEDGGDFK
jgi:type IV secretory pathway TraG/TraD family ATPase VirD4